MARCGRLILWRRVHVQDCTGRSGFALVWRHCVQIGAPRQVRAAPRAGDRGGACSHTQCAGEGCRIEPAQRLGRQRLLLGERREQRGLEAVTRADGVDKRARHGRHLDLLTRRPRRRPRRAVGHSAACLLDLDAVIVDGSFSRELLGALLAATSDALGRCSWEGVVRPQLMAGTIGLDARAIGGALLPLYANFAPDRDLFLKLDA